MFDEYTSKMLVESPSPDGGKSVVADVTNRYDPNYKCEFLYKVWSPQKNISDDPGLFFSSNFPSFSHYLKNKYGKFDVVPTQSVLLEDFPLKIPEFRRYGADVGLSLVKDNKRFGYAQVHNWDVGNCAPEQEYNLWQRLLKEEGTPEKVKQLVGKRYDAKICSAFKEFSYIPDVKQEIPDSDFFKIMKNEIMNHKECVNYKRNIEKKVVLNEDEFTEALDMWVNKKNQNAHWKTDWRGEDLISKHNEKRIYDLFFWTFKYGDGHRTSLKAYSCDKCDDVEREPDGGPFFVQGKPIKEKICPRQDIPRSSRWQNTKNGVYTYEPLNIQIPFP